MNIPDNGDPIPKRYGDSIPDAQVYSIPGPYRESVVTEQGCDNEHAILAEGHICEACGASSKKPCSCPDDEFHIECDTCHKHGIGACENSRPVPDWCSSCPANHGMICHCGYDEGEWKTPSSWTTCWGCMMGYENQQGHTGEGGCCNSQPQSSDSDSESNHDDTIVPDQGPRIRKRHSPSAGTPPQKRNLTSAGTPQKRRRRITDRSSVPPELPY